MFWEGQEGEKDQEALSDEEWLKRDKARELKMKKLMTVAKSKYYMLKVNYAKVFEQVDFEAADGSVDRGQPTDGDDRLHQDLERGDPNASANNQNVAGNER